MNPSYRIRWAAIVIGVVLVTAAVAIAKSQFSPTLAVVVGIVGIAAMVTYITTANRRDGQRG